MDEFPRQRPGGPLHEPIPRVTTRRELLEAVRERRPVLYSLGEADSKAWAGEVLASLQGTRLPVQFEQGERPSKAGEPYVTNLGWILKAKHGVKWLTVDEAFATGGRFVISGTHLWLRESRPETRRPGEYAEFRPKFATSAVSVINALDDLVPEDSEQQITGCWISSRGIETPMHWDLFGGHNFHFICAGEKQVYLYPYEEAEHIYCVGGPPKRSGFGCAVDPSRPDFERYPRYVNAKGLYATIKAGDVLFIPAHCWHHFLHTGDLNLSVTRWFHEPVGQHPSIPPLPARIHLNFLRFIVFCPLLDLLSWLASPQSWVRTLALWAAFIRARGVVDHSRWDARKGTPHSRL